MTGRSDDDPTENRVEFNGLGGPENPTQVTDEHVFKAKAVWNKEAGASASILLGSDTHTVHVPDALGGSGPGTTPEELLCNAISSCICFTFLRACRMTSIRPGDLEVTSSVRVAEGPTGGHNLTAVDVHFKVDVPKKMEEKTIKAINAASRACLVIRVMAGNVPVNVTHELEYP